MSAQDLGPLDWRVAITDSGGRPTPEFQRRWNTQRNNNDLIGVTLGSGAPTTTPTQDGEEYLDTSATPPVLYVSDNGGWTKVGVQLFTQLTDVPNSYASAGNKIVQVNAGATGLQFTALSGILDLLGSATGDILYRGSSGWTTLAPGSNGNILSLASGIPAWTSGAFVTSVGLSLPATFTVTGSPVTSSGTLTATYVTQSANTVFAGPTTGAAATPTFRTLVPADLPLFSSTLAGAVTASGGGTTNFLRADGTWAAPPGGGGAGTVTSVALSMPGIFGVAGSPITTSGTFNVTLNSESANTVLAGPTSGAGSSLTIVQQNTTTTNNAQPVLSVNPTVGNYVVLLHCITTNASITTGQSGWTLLSNTIVGGNTITVHYRQVVGGDTASGYGPALTGANVTSARGQSFNYEIHGISGTFASAVELSFQENVSTPAASNTSTTKTPTTTGDMFICTGWEFFSVFPSTPSQATAGFTTDSVASGTFNLNGISAHVTSSVGGTGYAMTVNWGGTTPTGACFNTLILSAGVTGATPTFRALVDADLPTTQAGKTFTSPNIEAHYTVATLPAVAGAKYGRAFVTDSSVAAATNYGAVVAGGGANIVSVYSDGTNWRIG